jgi:SAM-dependent methyltransferase
MKSCDTPEADQQRIARYYNDLVDRFGHDPRACDASSSASLEIRYKVLAGVCDLTGLSVLEVGCGFGDLGVHVCARFPEVRYTGVDLSPRMVEEARRCHPGLEFFCSDLMALPDTAQYDVVLAQGIFYLLREDAEARTQAMIAKMYALARKAVAFSAISSWTTRKTPGEHYLDPATLLGTCRALTSKVVLRHDHLPNDVAVYLYK